VIDHANGGNNMEIGRESYAIPFSEVNRAVQQMPKNTDARVMFIMLVLTGCRIKALDKMRPDRIMNGYLYYDPGKKQGSLIKERMPDWFLEELRDYRDHRKVPGNALFAISSETFRRYFNRDIRPSMPGTWMKKILIPFKDGLKMEFIYELKGLRKNFQTLEFARQMKHWGNPEIALQFTSKKMKHSTTRITAHHYLCNFENLGIRPDLMNLPETALQRIGQQSRLLDYW